MALDRISGKVLVGHQAVADAWGHYKEIHGLGDWQHGQDDFCKLLGTTLGVMQSEYHVSTDSWQLTPEAARKIELLNSEHWHAILKVMEAKEIE